MPQFMEQASKIRALLCPRDKWVQDKEVSKCSACQRTFIPLLVWKHHCRFCGNVFCNDCSANIITGASIGYETEKKLRHCNACKYRIETVLKKKEFEEKYKKQNTLSEINISMIEIEQPDIHYNNSGEKRTTYTNIKNQMNIHRDYLKSLAMSILRQLSKELCHEQGLEAATWELRLAELAWKAACDTQPTIFIRKEPFKLSEEIKVLTIIAPTQAVCAVCVKGIVLEKIYPSKQLDSHLKYPRIVTVKPSIEADSLMNSKQVRFDDIVNNEQKYLRRYLEPLFKLNPNILFVQGNVSKGAIELALERKIMIIPKVKNEDLCKIERLALIRRRIDNLLMIEKNQVAEIIGCCQRVYFKTIRQGEVLLFVEHEAGVTSVLLGDMNEASNNKLKAVFELLLRAAWNLKMQRQLAIRQMKISQQIYSECQCLSPKSFAMQKYLSASTFRLTQKVNLFRMRFCVQRIESLPKQYQEYCKVRDRRRMLQACGDIDWRTQDLYNGEQPSLGTFLVKCAIQSGFGCSACGGSHLYRFYLDSFCINVLIESSSSSGKLMRLDNHLEEENEKQRENYENELESSSLYKSITKFIHAWRLEQPQKNQKLLFRMYFTCTSCLKAVSTQQANVGNDFLTMSFNHFLQMILHSFRACQRAEHFGSQIEQECKHPTIARTFQCPRSLVTFAIEKVDKYQILPIQLNKEMIKRVSSKDQSMVRQLFILMLTEKKACIESLEKEMEILPFSRGTRGMATTISIAGASALDHIYFQPYQKIEEAIAALKDALRSIEDNLQKEIQEGHRDWTILMRKFSKIDHVIKASSEIIIFLINAIKKQKIEQNLSQFQSSIEDHIQLNSFVFEEKLSHPEKQRKFSEQRSETEELMKSQSIPASYSSFAVTRMRKQTSVQLQSEIDVFLRKLRKQRFLLFQGSCLYYPIGNIEDAVSLLACCLNSDEFKQNLKEGLYKDYITTRIQFTKQLRTNWPPTPRVVQVYKQLIKQDFYSKYTQEIEFSIYYHKQFEELRISEGIDFRLYVRSLYGCQNWDSSGGKSNSTFSKAHNQTLVVKIINQKEFVEFQKFAPAYLKYMKQKRENNKQSYLAKIYGIYEVIIKSKVYKCVVMQNIFFGLDVVTKVYDLKGSEVNRLAQPSGDKSYTGLDTNFLLDRDSSPYLLQPTVYDKVIQALSEDAFFLKDQGVIDYSLLAIESGNSLRMGIIDFMRPYHFVEKIETLYKQIKSGKDPTVIPPVQYAQRFVRSMHRYFAKSESTQINGLK